MFGLFKNDPVKKLEKEHKRLLDEAFRMSKVDRTKSDELTAKAAQIEEEIMKLRSN
ncbi:MAG: Lacal_2735 family protein [Flavobacteriales bacterium]|uniref:Lacal_2735 family protein n=1 Tax=Sanyastnella coralliicola TaxID=3069118 RepID=UPI0027B964F8|nr:Lacal_2735 family protein [Longitalea sp. SCSIO 12813]MCH2200250.1 Lacal_2735 family protein [Flavobacteriales bacterium]